jgi:hypothetical protein
VLFEWQKTLTNTETNHLFGRSFSESQLSGIGIICFHHAGTDGMEVYVTQNHSQDTVLDRYVIDGSKLNKSEFSIHLFLLSS